MSVSLGEAVMLAIIVLIVFSASRMSALGNALGKFVYSFKQASRGDGFIDVSVRSNKALGSKQMANGESDLIESKRKSSPR